MDKYQDEWWLYQHIFQWYHGIDTDTGDLDTPQDGDLGHDKIVVLPSCCSHTSLGNEVGHIHML